MKRIVVLEDEAAVRRELGGRADPALGAPAAASLDLKAAVRRAAREVERFDIVERHPV